MNKFIQKIRKIDLGLFSLSLDFHMINIQIIRLYNLNRALFGIYWYKTDCLYIDILFIPITVFEKCKDS